MAEEQHEKSEDEKLADAVINAAIKQAALTADHPKQSAIKSFVHTLNSIAAAVYKKLPSVYKKIKDTINPPPPPDINTAEDDARIAANSLFNCWNIARCMRDGGSSTQGLARTARYIERARSKNPNVKTPYFDGTTERLISLDEMSADLLFLEARTAVSSIDTMDAVGRYGRHMYKKLHVPRYKQSLVAIQKALAYQPDNLTYLFFLAETYRSLERRNDAIKTIQHILTIEPRNLGARQELDRYIDEPDYGLPPSLFERIAELATYEPEHLNFYIIITLVLAIGGAIVYYNGWLALLETYFALGAIYALMLKAKEWLSGG